VLVKIHGNFQEKAYGSFQLPPAYGLYTSENVDNCEQPFTVQFGKSSDNSVDQTDQ